MCVCVLYELLVELEGTEWSCRLQGIRSVFIREERLPRGVGLPSIHWHFTRVVTTLLGTPETGCPALVTNAELCTRPVKQEKENDVFKFEEHVVVK